MEGLTGFEKSAASVAIRLARGPLICTCEYRWNTKDMKQQRKKKKNIPTIARESLPKVRDTDRPTIRVESCSSNRDPVSGDSVRTVEGDIMRWFSVESHEYYKNEAVR